MVALPNNGREAAFPCIIRDLHPRLPSRAGNSTHAAPPTGQQMAALALAEGVPASAIVIEDQSESTLQNALFTLPKLETLRGVILVTDSFHLPRSGLSFLWAGARDIQLFPAYGPSQTLMPGHWTIAMEAVKLWANALAGTGLFHGWPSGYSRQHQNSDFTLEIRQMTVILEGYIDVPEPRRSAIKHALPDHIQHSRAEPGCLRF